MKSAVKKAGIAAAAGMLAAGVVAGPASARWMSPEEFGWVPDPGVSMRVEDTVKLSKDGYEMTWQIKFTCPKNDTYTLELWLGQRDHPLVPELQGEDTYIGGHQTLTGVCTGSTQSNKDPVPVEPITYTKSGGTSVTEHIAVTSTDAIHTTSSAILSTGSLGYAVGWCAAPNCASVTGAYISFK